MVTVSRFTLEEFLGLPGIDESRLELIDGEVYEKLSPRWGHGRVAGEIWHVLNQHGFAAVEPRAVIGASADLRPASPIPDVAYYRENPPPDDEWMTRPPHVVVEVLSLGQDRRQMRAKVDVYRAFGVPSVWVVDLEREEIEIYEAGGRRTLSGQDVVQSPEVPGLRATVEQILGGRRAERGEA